MGGRKVSEIEIALLFLCAIVILGFVTLAGFIYEFMPEKLWKEFKLLKEKEAEEAKNKLLEADRAEYEAWRRSKQGASTPSPSPSSRSDKPINPNNSNGSDDLDINNPDNWY